MASVDSNSNEALSLNIMPLLDIFSILILFLLMSFSTDPISHDVNPALELPDSRTIRSLDEIPSLVVTKNDVFVNDKKVSSIINGDIQERDRSQGAIYPLYEALTKLAEANKRITENKKDASTLTLEMDKDHDFKLLKRIMLSAQQAKFIAFKLMAAKSSRAATDE
ncbi:MAG: biopolymer transporter ExbD [Bdellovibrionota bacterium]